MKKDKKFDCVEMKWAIQRQIAKEFSGMSDEQAHGIQMNRVMQNPILGPFCKKVQASRDISTK
jgi:hypothetical protein